MKLIKLCITHSQLKRLIAIELEEISHLEAKIAAVTRSDAAYAGLSRKLYQSKADLAYLQSYLEEQLDDN